MRVLTYATEQTAGLARFQESCACWGFEPEVYGLGMPYPGHVSRLKRLYPVVAEADPDEILLFIDGYDSVVAASRPALECRFKEIEDGRVLFGAEVVCEPQPQTAPLWPPVETPYRYLNAGTWIARARYIRALWEAIDVLRLPDSVNDQGILGDYLLCNPGAFQMDHYAHLIQNLYAAADHIDFTPGKNAGRNRHTGSFPQIFHASGHSDLSGAYAYSVR